MRREEEEEAVHTEEIGVEEGVTRSLFILVTWPDASLGIYESIWCDLQDWHNGQNRINKPLPKDRGRLYYSVLYSPEVSGQAVRLNETEKKYIFIDLT